MKALAVPLVALFEKKMRLEVPLFQRQYVWTKEHQWEPLWEDIERKFVEYLEGRTDAPVHFLGAIVLDQKQTPTTHVERRMVIDGQQRLTTLQVFLSSFRDYCRSVSVDTLADEAGSFTFNKGMMPDPDVDKFKVWPTQLDRQYFMDVMTAGSPAALEAHYPVKRRKYARQPDPRPLIVECYFFFYARLKEFFEGAPGEEPIAGTAPLDNRLEECFQALRNALLVVTIDLEHGDDAQVIFETLNARGEPLLPADLLRNYIFLRASRHGLASEPLYNKYWLPFDSEYWRVSVSQGRISRPRSDLFMQHFLASQQTIDIPVKHLYVEYRHWIEKHRPYEGIENELRHLSSQRDLFKSLMDSESGKSYSDLAKFLSSFDIGTAYPLLLLVASTPDKGDHREIYTLLESYLLRRAICGMTNKNYNRVFLGLTRLLKRDGVMASIVYHYLDDLRGETVEWPSDDKFSRAWEDTEVYTHFSNARIVYILTKIDRTFRGPKSEDIEILSPLSIEHLMPQDWVANWPLAGGEAGMRETESLLADPGDPRAVASRRRDSMVQTIGNLTMMTQGLNAAVSNGSWEAKKPELARHSLLPINSELAGAQEWNEGAILGRSRALFARAVKLWPHARIPGG